MPIQIIQLLKDYWYVPVILALAALLGLFQLQKQGLKTDLAEAKTAYVTLEGEFDKLKILTEQCNTAVIKLGQAKKELDQNLTDANVKLKQLSAQQTVKVQSLRSAQVPSDCSGAMLYLGRTTQKEVQEWRSSK
jgi:chromosome segregation ATPase